MGGLSRIGRKRASMEQSVHGYQMCSKYRLILSGRAGKAVCGTGIAFALHDWLNKHICTVQLYPISLRPVVTTNFTHL